VIFVMNLVHVLPLFIGILTLAVAGDGVDGIVCAVLQNSAESLEKALSIVAEVKRPALRAAAFTALLALTQVSSLFLFLSRLCFI